jgi:hypothetical protein
MTSHGSQPHLLMQMNAKHVTVMVGPTAATLTKNCLIVLAMGVTARIVRGTQMDQTVSVVVTTTFKLPLMTFVSHATVIQLVR